MIIHRVDGENKLHSGCIARYVLKLKGWRYFFTAFYEVLFVVFQTGFPSRQDSPSCVYSRMDFDSDEDFNSFFSSRFYQLILL